MLLKDKRSFEDKMDGTSDVLMSQEENGSQVLSFGEIEQEILGFFSSLYQKSDGYCLIPANILWEKV